MPDTREAVIISAARTPTGKFQGSLKGFTATQLGAMAVREAVRRSGVAVEDVDEVIMGCVIQAGLGEKPRRQAGVPRGIPFGRPGGRGKQDCGAGPAALVMGAPGVQRRD